MLICADLNISRAITGELVLQLPPQQVLLCAMNLQREMRWEAVQVNCNKKNRRKVIFRLPPPLFFFNKRRRSLYLTKKILRSSRYRLCQ